MSHSSHPYYPTPDHTGRVAHPRPQSAAAVSRHLHRAHAGGLGDYTLVHGGRQIRIGPVAFWIAVGTLVVMAVWSVATGSYFAFSNDVLTRLIGRQAELQFAYEDRIAELRGQVDRITSRQLLDQEQFEQYFLFELHVDEQLLAGDAIDLSAQFGDAVLIGELHGGLAADQPGQHVLAEGEISAGRDRPDAHDDECTDHDPERHRPDADLAAGMDQRVAGASAAAMRGVRAVQVAGNAFGRLLARNGGAAGVLVMGIGRIRHERSAPAGRRRCAQKTSAPISNVYG